MSIDDMIEIRLRIRKQRPAFHSIPEFLWGKSGGFDSDGDCTSPDDRMWTQLDVSSRPNGIRFSVIGDDGLFEGGLRIGNKAEGIYTISSNDVETAAKVAYFLWKQCGAEFLDKNQEALAMKWKEEK